jgi:hypothetical protein
MRPATGASRPGGETHRDLADAFGLRAQRRRHGAGEHRAPTRDAGVPPKPEEREHPGHRPAVRHVQESAAEPSPDEKDRARCRRLGPATSADPPRFSPRALGCSSLRSASWARPSFPVRTFADIAGETSRPRI